MTIKEQSFDPRHIAFVVRLPVRHDRIETFEKSLVGIVERMTSEPDFMGTWLHRDIHDPDTFVLYERWACSKDEFLERHLGKEYRVTYEGQLSDMLKAPRTIEFLNTQGIWARQS